MRCMILALALLAGATAARAADPGPPPVEAYGRAAAVSDLSLSPSGKRAAFLVSNAAGRRIAVQEVGGKLLLTIDPGAGNKLWNIIWAGDDHLIVITSSTINLGPTFGFRNELSTAQVVNLKTLKTFVVFAHEHALMNTIGGGGPVAQRDGRWYGYFIREGVSGPSLYEVDLDSQADRLVGPGSDHPHSWALSLDGQVIAHSEYDEKTGDWRLLLGPGSGGREIMARKTPLDEIDLVGPGRGPGTVLVEDDTGQDIVYEEVSLADGKVQTLFADDAVKSLITDQNTGYLLGAAVKDPAGAVLFDPVLQAKVRGALKAFAGKHAELVSYDPAFDAMVISTDGDDSGTYWFVDIPKGSAVPLGPSRPDIPASAVGPTRMFAYKASDGLDIEGVLTLPPGRDPKGLALIVMPHGGPLGERDDIGFDWWAQTYASRGYAVFQPNYRGSGGYGLAFEHKGYGEWGRRMLSDVSDGVQALAAAGVVDPRRACIVGGSYGGYAALAGVTLQHGLYRCAVAVAPVADMPSFRSWALGEGAGGEGDEGRRYWRVAIEGLAKDEPGLSTISPARHAGAADAPILLIHGRDDTVVPIDQSRKMEAALKSAGKPVQLIELPGQDHWLTDETTRIQMLKASVDFVLKNNPPD